MEIDGWFGPEERPRGGDPFRAYARDGKRIYSFIAEYSPSEDAIFYMGNECDYPWANIICWKTIDNEEMPERFKVKEETKS